LDHRKSKRIPEKHLLLQTIDQVKAFDWVDDAFEKINVKVRSQVSAGEREVVNRKF